ncbi:aldo/keto reductase [Dactylosporangium sp. NPDC000244]|uniref:aldo/keto reductase n=1 Tax=Dactylosporangium sp. NPDC000244 TaxID=3154365 RepID=UPI00331D560B
MTALGLGCAQLGNLWRERCDAEARAIVDAAWECGIRTFDTAPHYGLGLSERRLGAALADRPRAEFTVSTKVGRLLEPVDGGGDDLADGFAVPRTHRRVWDFSRDGVRRSLEASLERLGLDRVDVALLHDPEFQPDSALRQGFPALAELRAEGVVGAIGAGSKDVTVLARVVAECAPDAVMVAGRYTLLEQPARDLLSACAATGVSVLAAGVFNSGLLAEDVPRAGLHYEYGDAPAALVARASRIASVCGSLGTTLPAAAIAFPGRESVVSAVVLGADDAGQVRRNAALFAAPPPDALWAELGARGLL